ncbi:MAG TPA: pyruvate kinase [Blastocatellia bacterium]|nr:pyruvate kinase [Blastocatellia bacterium]
MLNEKKRYEAKRELDQLDELSSELISIHEEMSRLEARALSNHASLHATHQQSARNLVHYLALRRHDIRRLQKSLTSLGLSSLGGSEAHVKLAIETLLRLLHRLAPPQPPPALEWETMTHVAEWRSLLDEHTANLLGPMTHRRSVRIMVTMPSEAATSYNFVRDLVAEGMDCMRINSAHDGIEEWGRMVANLRKARKATGNKCRILIDLPGPKLRTGPMQPGPQVLKWRPHRDVYGRVVKPARIWLSPVASPARPPTEADAHIPLAAECVSSLRPGDVLRFFDARGASRSVTVTESVAECRWATSEQTAYVTPGTTMHPYRGNGFSTTAGIPGSEVKVAALPPHSQSLTLRTGDILIMTSDSVPGSPPVFDTGGRMIEPARIGVTLPEIFSDVRPGESIWLDDGKIGGRILKVASDEMQVEITQARDSGERLMADKGINLPDSNLQLPALTSRDLDYLSFIAASADLVGYSFVRRASDVYELQDRLQEVGGREPGVVLKIETKTAFERLPELLLAAMRSPSAGVMIARGDLAVECGYERLAEVQEEILWICEAAHVPVIWATQVLENLAKGGVPSRAEITDAAMGERAECVMLNKGPYVVEAVRALDNILRRMQAHQAKKKSMLRSLKVADKFQLAAQSR